MPMTEQPLHHADDVTFDQQAYADVEAAADVDDGILHADDIAGRHRYLAAARPDWKRSMSGIKRDGGPWHCHTCDGASFLFYRCSICGAELTGSGKTSTGPGSR